MYEWAVLHLEQVFVHLLLFLSSCLKSNMVLNNYLLCQIKTLIQNCEEKI